MQFDCVIYNNDGEYSEKSFMGKYLNENLKLLEFSDYNKHIL